MSERPKKINVEEVLMGRKSDNYRIGWNACIDAYEQWEKSQPKDAVSVDKEIIIDFINDVESGIKYLELNKQDYGYGKDRLRQKIATITRKLKGQDNEDFNE